MGRSEKPSRFDVCHWKNLDPVRLDEFRQHAEGRRFNTSRADLKEYLFVHTKEVDIDSNELFFGRFLDNLDRIADRLSERCNCR